ncbi:MAG: RagB/SusD family nutrient uptake outer membrane protein [Gemmatimonadaceae bacterium]|nr:RagB/SusD family nutrient uptake outer membrane protein [Gemmatimonadaceae bacterium]
MLKHTRMLLLSGVALAALTSCTDVTVEPKSSISSSNIFSEPAAYRQFLAKIYGGLALTGQSGPDGSRDIESIDEGFSHYLRVHWMLSELPTDEAVLGWGDPGIPELNTQLWASANAWTTAMYYRILFQVAMANQFLRETSDAKIAERGVTGTLATDIKQYRAEARFLRALSYWHAIDMYGNVPLVTEATEVGKTPPDQATRADLYAFVVSELNAIRGDLPAVGAGQYGRADQGAVAMLLAKVYLNAGVYTGTPRYSEARAEAERVIAGRYRLDANLRRIFGADNHISTEIIFAVPFDGEKTRTWGGMTFLTHAAVGNQMNAADYGLDGGWWGLRVKPEILPLFPGNGGPSSPDKRSAFFFAAGQTTGIGAISDFTNGIAAPKFTNIKSTGGAGSNLTFPDTDFPMFRLADAYLIYAEAVTRGGGGSRATALGYINELRQRAYGNASGNITDAQMTTDFMLDERARELMWEGHRRTDLIRYGRFTTAGIWAWKGNVAAGRTTEAFRNLFPLPATDLIANPKLKQNTGY